MGLFHTHMFVEVERRVLRPLVFKPGTQTRMTYEEMQLSLQGGVAVMTRCTGCGELRTTLVPGAQA